MVKTLKLNLSQTLDQIEQGYTASKIKPELQKIKKGGKKTKIRSTCNAQPQDGKASARCKLQQRHQRYLYCYSDTATRKCDTHPLKQSPFFKQKQTHVFVYFSFRLKITHEPVSVNKRSTVEFGNEAQIIQISILRSLLIIVANNTLFGCFWLI